MTAGVAVLNKHGVTLAADSLGIFKIDEKEKFVLTDKIFSLSPHTALGIMIYDSTNFTTIPWDIVIKLYKSFIGNKSFNTLQEYANNFFAFLSTEKKIHNLSAENLLVESILEYCLNEIGKEYTSTQDYNTTLITETDRKIKYWANKSFLDGFNENFIKLFLQDHKTHLQNYLKELPNFNIDTKTEENLILLCAYIISKSTYLVDYYEVGGIVFTGYGDNDVFPSLYEYKIIGVISGNLIYKLKFSKKIGTDSSTLTGLINPVGYTDVINNYIFGIDSEIESLMSNKINTIFDNLFESIQNIYTNNSSYKFSSKDGDLINDLAKKYKSELIEYFNNIQNEKYLAPLSNILKLIGKDEIITLAEALISITCTKSKFSTHSKTVGPPIDVALITKGDGFKWIKKKQYFNSELNTTD